MTEMRPFGRWLVTGAAVLCACGAWAQTDAPIVLENDTVRWEIGADGLNKHFTDKATGQDYLKADPACPVAAVKKGTVSVPCTKASLSGDTLTLSFAGAEAGLRVALDKRFLTLEVMSVSGEGVDELTFFDVPLTLKGQLDEPFAACVLAFNLKTNVPEVPGPSRQLHAMCIPRFGMVGAKAAIVAGPMAALRDVMKEAVSTADELPKTNIGGPWALDGEINRGSYLFDFGALNEETVDDWVKTVKALGLNQVDFHTGTSLRFGDCFPNPKIFPNGRASVKAVIDKLHAAGISAGLHTYSFFIAKDAKYVTPVPDPRLGKDRILTLAAAIPADAAAVAVDESTADMHTTTGFFVHNSVTVQIDDELITYTGVSKEAPFGFTGCTRGAYGTKAAAHEKGAKVSHLKECFGLFTPDADSTLLSEVAFNTADTFNACGFDMIYLDALDGEAILGGADLAWHYGSKFVFEIANRLERPALFEMSTFHHHLWYVRARMGAWDHPGRAHKRFVDVHAAANASGAGTFLPMNMGWWAVQTWKDGSAALWNEPTYPDDIEYLMTKCLANNFSVSLMGVNPDTLKGVPAYERLAPIFRKYEDLRHAKTVPDSILKRLADPGKDFTMETGAGGAAVFCPVEYTRHKAQIAEDGNGSWTVKNNFDAQPAQLRIEALYSAGSYDAPEAAVIEDFTKPDAYGPHTTASGVQVSLATDSGTVRAGAASGLLAGKSDRPEPDGAYGSTVKNFTPPLSIAGKEALGVWVYGDGKGETLNVQLMSPTNTTSLGYGDHHISIDFTGWRYFELLEIESTNIAEHNWPYRNAAYAVYREGIDYAQIAQMSFWYNNLPQGRDVACYLGPIKALPLVKAKLRNPKVTIGGKTLVFPVELETGSYIEYRGAGNCSVYGSKGELLNEVTPQGDTVSLEPGDNAVQFNCDGMPGVSSRACVTVSSRGGPISE